MSCPQCGHIQYYSPCKVCELKAEIADLKARLKRCNDQPVADTVGLLKHQMKITPLQYLGQIKEGDILLIHDGREVIPAKAKRVKVSEYDGEEIIFRTKANKFFNVGMYLAGRSWAKGVCIVHI